MKKILPLSFLFLLLVAVPAQGYYFVDSFGDVYFGVDGEVLGKNTENREQAGEERGEIKRETVEVRKVELKPQKGEWKVNLGTKESTPSSEIEIEEAEETDNIRLSGSTNSAQIIRNKIAAQTHFPLSVNLETNELMVTTPKGTKIVTILPDQAVAHMLAANVLDQAGGKGGLIWLASRPTATPSAQITVTEAPEASPTGEIGGELEATPTMELEMTPTTEPEATPTAVPQGGTGGEEEGISLTQQEDGTLTYEIPGTRNKKLFGFYRVTLKRTAIVSAETGELVRIDQTLQDRILDFLSK